MTDPVATSDGHSYEHDAIVQWLRNHDTSPVTGAALEHTNVTENHTLRKSIDEWRQHRFNMIRACDLEVEPQAIAAGSFKTVSRGQLKRLPGTTALLQHPQTVAVMELRDGGELAAEAKILLRLAHHPRLVRYIGMCTEREQACLVTEFAEKGSMSDAIQDMGDDMTPAHELVMLQQMSSGMEMIAAEGLVHRDLALRNLLLFAFDKDDVNVTSVKVSDFGLTVNTYGNSHKTVSAGAKPVRWMSPEALRRNRFSEQSDVWAFGITAFELLSRGEMPYYHINEDDRVISFVTRDKGKPARPDDDELPCSHTSYDGVWTLLESCWHFGPRDRPSFSQLSIALGQMPVPDKAIQIPPPSPDTFLHTSVVDTANKFVLKSTGQLVTMQWVFENGYNKSDCETVAEVAQR
jgi:serine/threonine protein kinase